MKINVSLFGLFFAAMVLLTSFKVDAASTTDWNTNVITVTGTGLPPRGAVGAQARVWAKRAAIADAQRQLAEAIDGVQVDAETTVEQLTLASDIIRTKISAKVKGARVVAENFNSDGTYEVTMQMPMFGSNGFAQAVIERPTEVIPFPTPQPVEQPSPGSTTTITVTVNGGYTGVIIDCRGFNVNNVMSPVIKDTSGTKLYGQQNLDYDLVIRDGMASYAHDMSQAGRAGSNPLIIKAQRMDDNNANPVLSVSDGNRLLLENNSSGFLSQTHVVFLY